LLTYPTVFADAQLTAEQKRYLIDVYTPEQAATLDLAQWQQAYTALKSQQVSGTDLPQTAKLTAKLVGNYGNNWAEYIAEPFVASNLKNAITYLPDNNDGALPVRNLEETRRFLNLWQAVEPSPEKFGLDSYNRRYDPAFIAKVGNKLPDAAPDVIIQAIRAHYPIQNPTAEEEHTALAVMADGWKVHPLVWPEAASDLSTMKRSQQLVSVGIIEQMVKEHNAAKGYGEQITINTGNGTAADKTVSLKQDGTEVTILSDLPHAWHTDSNKVQEFQERYAESRKLAIKKQLATYVTDSPQNRSEVFDLLHGRVLDFPSELKKELVDRYTIEQLTELNAPQMHNVYTAVRGTDRHEPWMLHSVDGLIKVFGNGYKDWLAKQPTDRSAHDATYFLNTKATAEELQGLNQWLFKNVKYQGKDHKDAYRAPKELEIVVNNWAGLSAEERKQSYHDLLATCRAKKYKGQRDVGFASESARWGISESDYPKFEEIYLRGQNVPEPFDSKESFEHHGLVGRFLPRNDPRVGYFGQHTNCCQHLTGQGKACAVSTMSDPFSQLFVVERDGKIIAGSWVWKSQHEYSRPENPEIKKIYETVTFDNIEALDLPDAQKSGVRSIYETVGGHLTQSGYRTVTVGGARNDISLEGLKSTEVIKLPSSYTGYTDAGSTQYLLAENAEALSLEHKPRQAVWTRGAIETDLTACEKIAKLVYPAGWDHVSLPGSIETAGGMILQHERDGVIGFVVWDKETGYISDMAVHPEHRLKSVVLLKNFLEQSVAEGNSQWFSADLKEDTSYKLLKGMEKRGLVELEEMGRSHYVGDAPCYKVRFRASQRAIEMTQTQDAEILPTGRYIQPTAERALAPEQSMQRERAAL
jgi:hypothetical protein